VTNQSRYPSRTSIRADHGAEAEDVMSAADLAKVVEGWATLAGLMVVVAGAVFAGVQLRRDSQSRRLQALVDLYSVVWSKEMPIKAAIVSSLPDDFDFNRLEPDQRDAVGQIIVSMNRLGHVLRAGLVRDHEIFEFAPLARAPIFHWEKLKRFVRASSFMGEQGGGLHLRLDFEYLAWRAQSYFTKHAVAQFGAIPVFDADLAAVNRVGQQAAQARVAAS
jgi:hypothetical protein